MRNSRLAPGLLITLGLWIAVTILRVSTSAQSGLIARYFSTIDWSGAPARTRLDPEISTLQLSRGWGFRPPDTYSVRWSGYLFVDRAGIYRFRTMSDDGSELWLDGRLVVENGGAHGLVAGDGRVRLESGSHMVVLLYSQAGGAYQLEWLWAREPESMRPVPAWLLSPRARSYSTLVVLGLLNWIWPTLTIALILLAGPFAVALGYWPRHETQLPAIVRPFRPAASSGPEPAEGQGRDDRAVLCLVLFIVLTCIHTWPLATNPAHLSRNDNADTVLNEWTIAWVAHELPRHPLQLFEANIFFPERHSVAFSETLFVQSVMAAPFLWLGASPVLAYNIVLLAGFALTGWTMCLVVARWTGDWAAGIASGMLMAFNAHTLTRLPHLQAQHGEFLPLALLSLDALLRWPRWSPAIWLALWFTLQALTSIYLLVFTTIAIAVAILLRPEDWAGARLKRVAPKLVIAGVLAAVALVPFLLPYWHLRQAGFARSLDEVGYFAAHARDYLTTPSRLYPWAGGTAALFPGIAALTLAAVAIASGIAFVDARPRMCLVVGICGVLLSFGPAIAPGYEFLYSTIPLLQGIRTTSRFGYLGLVAVAVLAGYGLALLRRRLALPVGWKHALSLAVLVLIAVEPLAAPMGYQPFKGIPSIYQLPATDSNAVIAEMPFPRPESLFRNAPFLLNSTLNWKPLLNGYSGFIPASYAEHYASFKTFPASDSVAALRQAGVTHVFVHLDQLSRESVEAVGRHPELRPVARDGSIALYRVDR